MQRMNRLFVLVSLLAVLALTAACGEVPAPTATATARAAAATAPAPTHTASPAATAIPQPAATSTVTPLSPSALATQLTNLLKPTLPTPNPTAGAANLSIGVLPLPSSLGSLWLAYTVGLTYQPQYKHSIAVYSYSGNAWQKLATAELACATYVDAKSVKQVQIEPARVWIEVDGGTGAHGGCFDLYSFDGKNLVNQISRQSPSPGMGSVRDLLGDGTNVVVLDQSDPYVFCYACGVRFVKFQVLRWDGKALADVKLSPLPDTAPADARKLNNQAVTYAQAGLWKDALQSIDQAAALKSQDEAIAWNAALIHLTADTQAKSADAFPLLGDVFMGDYDGALGMMRKYQPQDLFGKTPSIVVPPAQGWEKAITQWITQTATLQLTAKPDLAGAYFMLAWGINLSNPSSPDVLAYLQKAAQLAPEDMLIMQSLAYVKMR